MTMTARDQAARGSTNHAGGRPRRYETPEQMEERVEAYFEQEDVVFTMTGLALFLGFTERKALWRRYGDKPEFDPILKTARTRIEEQYERRLVSGKGQVAGPIFALKQLGWTDSQSLTVDVGDDVQSLLTWVQGRDRMLPQPQRALPERMDAELARADRPATRPGT